MSSLSKFIIELPSDGVKLLIQEYLLNPEFQAKANADPIGTVESWPGLIEAERQSLIRLIRRETATVKAFVTAFYWSPDW